MQQNTEELIDSIMGRVVEAAVPIGWKSEAPLPGLGERKSSFRGTGTEFFELDDYQPGDDARTIDWAATAKTGGRRILKIVHQEEKQVTAHVLVNIDRSMDFGTVRCSKKMLAAELMASIFHSIGKTRDRVGMMLYSRDGVHDEIPAGSVVNTLYPALASLIESNASANAPADGNGLSRALHGLPTHRSLVFVVSDFLNMSAQDWNDLGNAGVMHDVICLYVQDVRERELPKVSWPGCAFELQDYDGGSALIWNNARTRRDYTARFKQFEQQVITAVKERHCDVVVMSTEEGDDAIPKVLNLFAGHE